MAFKTHQFSRSTKFFVICSADLGGWNSTALAGKKRQWEHAAAQVASLRGPAPQRVKDFTVRDPASPAYKPLRGTLHETLPTGIPVLATLAMWCLYRGTQTHLL